MVRTALLLLSLVFATLATEPAQALTIRDCQTIKYCKSGRCAPHERCRQCDYKRMCDRAGCVWRDVCVWGAYRPVLPNPPPLIPRRR